VAPVSRAKRALSAARILNMQSVPSQTGNPPPGAAPDPPAAPSPACANCGAPLYGKYCYACGQPTEGLVRHFGSVLSDVADSVLNVDERILHTLVPLYLRPGKLTLDYFAGKRARYVTPFRLVFFLAIIAFFAVQITVRSGLTRYAHFEAPPGSAAAGTGEQDRHFANGDITFNGKVVWNRQSKPLRLAWLPDFADDWFNDLIENARVNLHDFSSGNPAQIKAAATRVTLGMFSVAPTVLFVLLPIFALILKIFYVFKRRFYMEHLIVAMHSHAFLMFSILVLIALSLLRGWITPHAAWMGVPFSLLHAAAWIWIFIYLFLMQKRVYRQGWFMTGLKFCCIGFCYSILVTFGLMFAALISLTGA